MEDSMTPPRRVRSVPHLALPTRGSGSSSLGLGLRLPPPQPADATGGSSSALALPQATPPMSPQAIDSTACSSRSGFTSQRSEEVLALPSYQGDTSSRSGFSEASYSLASNHSVVLQSLALHATGGVQRAWGSSPPVVTSTSLADRLRSGSLISSSSLSQGKDSILPASRVRSSGSFQSEAPMEPSVSEVTDTTCGVSFAAPGGGPRSDSRSSASESVPSRQSEAPIAGGEVVSASLARLRSLSFQLGGGGGAGT
mmetsp:Transcript_34447/g.80551  ORF Transcript_34447/g.80551 Transcript_34447/m.80551 type:complete len:255 (+) Transcript_34447:1-765(+)